jgi:hypothetical protein
LKRHLASHGDGPDIRCPHEGCGYICYRRDNLAGHIRTMHQPQNSGSRITLAKATKYIIQDKNPSAKLYPWLGLKDVTKDVLSGIEFPTRANRLSISRSQSPNTPPSTGAMLLADDLPPLATAGNGPLDRARI